MKCVLALALLAISQIRLIAAAPQQGAEPERQEQQDDADVKPRDIKYTDIFTNTEKRFTVVMQLMKDDGFNAELLKAAHDAISSSSNVLFKKWAHILSQAYPNRLEGAVEQSPLPSWLKTTAVKTNSDQATHVKTALTHAGQDFHKLFKQLFDDYATKLKKETAAETETAKTQEGVAAASSVPQFGQESQPAQTSDGDDLLNLRFVMTPFKADLYELYDLIKEMKATTEDEKAALKKKVTDWVKEKVPSVEPKEEIDGHEVQQQLKKIIVTDTHLTDCVMSLESYNQMDADLTEAFEKCKKMNSASFGTIGLLLAAVLAFTMW